MDNNIISVAESHARLAESTAKLFSILNDRMEISAEAQSGIVGLLKKSAEAQEIVNGSIKNLCKINKDLTTRVKTLEKKLGLKVDIDDADTYKPDGLAGKPYGGG